MSNLKYLKRQIYVAGKGTRFNLHLECERALSQKTGVIDPFELLFYLLFGIKNTLLRELYER